MELSSFMKEGKDVEFQDVYYTVELKKNFVENFKEEGLTELSTSLGSVKQNSSECFIMPNNYTNEFLVPYSSTKINLSELSNTPSGVQELHEIKKVESCKFVYESGLEELFNSLESLNQNTFQSFMMPNNYTNEFQYLVPYSSTKINLDLSTTPSGNTNLYYIKKEESSKHISESVKVIGQRQILKGVSGSFRNGQLSAIMGPSGAGKSSLLNAISGYCTSNVTGHMKIDRKSSCYITQEDHHQTLLSVEELMHLSCDLKLKRNACRNKEKLIEDILTSLNLNHRRSVKANKLSGGERKRLSVALELVANPKIFFLDEPTSGLDEVTALQCVRLLSQLAKQGHTVVCTIHQPSATVFNYFDSVYVLAQGKCVYQGPPKAIVPFLRYAQKECPKHYSPSDYIIELCDFEDPNMISHLTSLTDNGKLSYISQFDTSKTDKTSSSDTQSFVFRHAVTTFFPDINEAPGLTSLFTKSHNAFLSGSSLLFDHSKTFLKNLSKNDESTSGFRQFCVLTRVMFLRILRARIPIVIQLIHHTMVGLFFGLIFYNIGNQGAHMFGHLKFCISAVMMIAYTQVTIPVLTYPSEVKIVKKETFNHWYSLTPYYMAMSISRLPLQILYNVIYLTIIYWMTGFPPQWWRFSIFVAVGLMTSFIAEGLGLSIGAIFSITNGSVVGPMIIASFMGLAIYGFDFASQIPEVMNFSMKTSFMRDAVVALVLTIFGYGRETLNCDEIYCHFSDPRVLLRFLDLEKVTLQQQFSYLFLLLLLFRSLLYITLKIRCKT